jgi:SAM-dependent methyltransferase
MLVTAHQQPHDLPRLGFRALGLGRRASQEKRFAALLHLGSLQGKRILDVGCGFGDLLAWLNARGIESDYTGIDIVRPMIERCRTRFHGTGARFYTGDALTFVTGEPYDYVVASGIFGYNARHTRELVRPTLEHLFSLARIGMAVNFLSCRAPTRSPGRLYLQPADVLQFAFELTPAVKLDHSYLPNDFTLCLYRRRPWEKE